MKTKLSQTEKARRQDWRDKHYASASIARPHHLTRNERLAGRKEKSQTVDLKTFVTNFFGLDEALKPKQPKRSGLRARAKRVIGATE